MHERNGLFRSRTDSVIGGIAGGLGKFFRTDSTIFRIIFVLVALFGGGGILLYLILWIAIPIEPAYSFNNLNNSDMENDRSKTESTDQTPEQSRHFWQRKHDGNLLAGLALITLGAIFLVDRFIPHVDFEDLWPIILLVAGIALIRTSYINRKSEKK